MKTLFKKLLQTFTNVGLILIIAMLGAIAGQGPKMLRRFILPAVVTIYAYFMLQNWWVLTCYLISLPLSIGYGIPSFLDNPAHPNYDTGSAIGAFFYKIFKKNEMWANVASRATVGLLISISMISIPILKVTWFSFLVGTIIIVGIWGTISWKAFGETKVKILGKEYSLLNVDLTVYGVTAVAFILIIQGFLK